MGERTVWAVEELGAIHPAENGRYERHRSVFHLPPKSSPHQGECDGSCDFHAIRCSDDVIVAPGPRRKVPLSDVCQRCEEAGRG